MAKPINNEDGMRVGYEEYKEETMQDYVKDKTAQESFLELASKVSEGEFAVTGIGPIDIYPERQNQKRHRITIDLIETPKTISSAGWYKTKELEDALVAGVDSNGTAFGRIGEGGDYQIAAIWDKYGLNIHPGKKEYDLRLKE